MKEHLLSSSPSVADDKGVKVWALANLGFQASQKILAAAHPLKHLRETCHNLPRLATALSRTRVNKTVKSAISRNQRFFRAGLNVLTINGRSVSLESVNTFDFLKGLSHDLSKAGVLKSIGVSAEKLDSLGTPATATAQIRLKVQGAPAIFANDLTSDSRYSRWPRSINDLLTPGWPGQVSLG